MDATGLNRQLLGYRNLLAESDQGSLMRCDAIADAPVHLLTLLDQAEQSVEALLEFDPLQALTPAGVAPSAAASGAVQPAYPRATSQAWASRDTVSDRRPAQRPVCSPASRSKPAMKNPVGGSVATTGQRNDSSPHVSARTRSSTEPYEPPTCAVEQTPTHQQVQQTGHESPRPAVATGAAPLPRDNPRMGMAEPADRPEGLTNSPLAPKAATPSQPMSAITERPLRAYPGSLQARPPLASRPAKVTTKAKATTNTLAEAGNSHQPASAMSATPEGRRKQAQGYARQRQTLPAHTPLRPAASGPKPDRAAPQHPLTGPFKPSVLQAGAGAMHPPLTAREATISNPTVVAPTQRPALRGLARNEITEADNSIRRPQASADAMNWHNMGFELGVDLT